MKLPRQLSSQTRMSHVTIYTKAYCSYCVRALTLLEQKGVDFTEIEAGFDPEKRQEMMRRSGRATFPQIFVGEQHIGGCDELVALERAGELDPLLQAAA
jgi:glutaredoxin 3